MSQESRISTAEQLLAIPNDGLRYELVKGDLRMMSPAGGRHGRVAMKLGRKIGDHVEHHQLGETYAAETGFLLKRNPDTVRAPDVAFVSRERLGDFADEPGYLPLAPDLVAEVISPNDRSSDVESKVLDWLEAGVLVVLLVDPQARTVCAYRSAEQVQIYTDGPIELDDAVRGLRLDTADLFG
jgi:Uma2 family endonuclease